MDLTLNSIMIPNLRGYTPPFGTKVTTGIDPYSGLNNKGGLNIQQVNDNIIAPFVKMRAVTVSAIDSTGTIEYDAKIFINAATAITLTIGAASYVGCKVTIINSTNLVHTLLYPSTEGGSTVQKTSTILENALIKIMWNGTTWQNVSAPSIGKRIIQYPQEKYPSVIYPCTSWEEITEYDGAFFRTFKQGVSEAFTEEGQTLAFQNESISARDLSFSGSPTTSTKQTSNNSYKLSATHYHTVTYLGRKGTGSSGISTFDTSSHDAESIIVDAATVDSKSITIPQITVSGTHKHSFTPSGTIISTGSETRPKNLTIKIWQRTA